jgi:Tfp pilus assembly protein FimT
MELMIVLAIVAIMASIAVPSFTRTIRDQRVLSASNALIAALALTRSEAISRGTPMTICVTADPNSATPACSVGTDWATGWLIYRTADAAVAPLPVVRVGAANPSVSMVGGNAVNYNNRGIPGAVATVVVKAASCDASVDKKITVRLNTAGLIASTAGTCP